MKCPKCKEEGFVIIKMMPKFHSRNSKALFGCGHKECGYKEVIG